MSREGPSRDPCRILLLTDGLANQGVTDPAALAALCRQAREQGITTTTLGFGEGFDEDLLRAMADAGGGATYYIETPDQAPGIFEEELAGLLSLAAQNVAVEVRTGPVVRLAAVRHSYPSSPAGEGVRLEMGDLYAREPKRLLVELLVEAVPGDGAGDSGGQELATLTVAADVLEAGGGMVHRQTDLRVVLDLEGEARVDPEVRRETLLLDAADARQDALEREAEGDPGGAADMLREVGLRLRERASELPDDERLQDEADDLERMAVRVREVPLTAADAKYMKQRAYESSRGRGEAWKRVSRKLREEGHEGEEG